MRISDWSSDVCSSDLGGLDAIGVAAEENLVEVELEDLLLAQHVLDAPGEEGFLDLAGVAQFVGQQQVLRHLLGDGRSADRAAAAGEVGDDGAQDARIVDAAMLEEGAVLGGEERLDHLARIFLIFENRKSVVEGKGVSVRVE